MVKIIAVVAMTDEGVMGDSASNDMPWRIGNYDLKMNSWWNSFSGDSFRVVDMHHFQTLTAQPNGAVLMGKNTWLSIPKKFRPLKNRTNIVISSTLEDDDVTIFSSLQEAKRTFALYDQVAIIGGARMYGATLYMVDEIHVTRIHKKFAGDIFFPDITNWKLVDEVVHPSKHFSFQVYRK